MRTQPARVWSVATATGRNLIAVAVTYFLALVFVQIGLRSLGGWPATEIGQSLALLLGVAISLRLRATIAVYFWSAMLAFSVSELAIHSFYGIRAAQGAATHFAVMGAALVGVALGALLMMRSRRTSGFAHS